MTANETSEGLASEAPSSADADSGAPKKRRSRRSRRGRSKKNAAPGHDAAQAGLSAESDAQALHDEFAAAFMTPGFESEPAPAAEPAGGESAAEEGAEPAPAKKKSRSRRSRSRKSKTAKAKAAEAKLAADALADASEGETWTEEADDLSGDDAVMEDHEAERDTMLDDMDEQEDEVEDEDEDDDFFDEDDEEAAAKPKGRGRAKAAAEPAGKPRRKMFISVMPGEQVELVLTEDGKLQEYYVELLHQAKTKGNIYKGTIHNIDAGLQAAFVNYGAKKNGFLQIDEVHSDYYQSGYQVPKGNRYPLIQNVLKPGQELLVQVVKEPVGTKGAFLTTYLSLPGRYFVLTPGREQTGVSRKIEDEEERRRLKEIVEKLKPGDDLGLIVRTVSSDQNQADLTKDIQYLKRLWKEITKRGTTAPAPALVYQEMELSSRAVRDYLTSDVGEVWVDDRETAEQVEELVNLVFPRRQSMIKVHDDPGTALFDRFTLTRQIEQIYSRSVTLPSGGQIVIDHAEALTAIDINSGKIGGKKNFKDMALKLNTEAAEEIARQLRLRDIGGQIVVDFVEMKDKKHVRDVEKAMRAAFKGDRARTDVGRISRFGLMELVRQRMGVSSISQSTEPCPACQGRGVRRNMEWQAMQAIKEIFKRLRAKNVQNPLVYTTSEELAAYLLNTKRDKIAELEERFGIDVHVSWS